MILTQLLFQGFNLQREREIAHFSLPGMPWGQVPPGRAELWEQTWEAGAAPPPRTKGQGGQSDSQRQGDGAGEGAGREGNHTAREMQQRVNCGWTHRGSRYRHVQ